MGGDPPSWSFPDGRITFEPGGQIEFSSAACPTANELLRVLGKWLTELQDEAGRNGVVLKTSGIEECVPIEHVPLQLKCDRYSTMTRYFDAIGLFGSMMMRQTASFQINVDRGPDPLERWRLLNALAPYLTAIFANSPRYAGAATGCRSYRATAWRRLDPQRTGIIYDVADPAARYLEFALDAPMILGSTTGVFQPFSAILDAGLGTMEIWETHLTTLFPEVRPRDYFEIRSIDAIAPRHLCAAIALVVGLVYSSSATGAALELLGDPDTSLLDAAGKLGLSHPVLGQRAKQLVVLAMAGCSSLGQKYISTAHINCAKTFFDSYTMAGLSPADDR